MRSTKAKSTVLLVVSIVFSGPVRAQQYKPAPISVQRSEFIAKVKALRAENPRMPATQLAEAANALLDKHGLAFAILFDTATCERIKKVKDGQKDPTAPLSIGATLKSVDAEGASLALPEPIFAPGGCGCYIDLPLLQITKTDFITVISGRNIRFHLPANFYSAEAALIDVNDKVSIRRTWRIPFRSVPIGVSHDENVLYLAFDEPELADLSLLVFGEGVFQIGTRADAEDGGKGKVVDGVPGGDRFIKFDRWGNSYLVRFKPPCR